MPFCLCTVFLPILFSGTIYIHFIFLRAGICSAAHWHLACFFFCYSHFVAVVGCFCCFFVCRFCCHCYCMSSCYFGAPALEIFMGSCHYRCHVLHVRFTNATDGLNPPPLFFLIFILWLNTDVIVMTLGTNCTFKAFCSLLLFLAIVYLKHTFTHQPLCYPISVFIFRRWTADKNSSQ